MLVTWWCWPARGCPRGWRSCTGGRRRGPYWRGLTLFTTDDTSPAGEPYLPHQKTTASVRVCGKNDRLVPDAERSTRARRRVKTTALLRSCDLLDDDSPFVAVGFVQKAQGHGASSRVEIVGGDWRVKGMEDEYFDIRASTVHKNTRGLPVAKAAIGLYSDKMQFKTGGTHHPVSITNFTPLFLSSEEQRRLRSSTRCLWVVRELLGRCSGQCFRLCG